MTLVIIIMLRLRRSFSICYCLMVLAYLMQSMVTFAVSGVTSASRSVTFRWRFTRPVVRRWSAWFGPLCATWMPMSPSKFTPFRHCQVRIRYFSFKLWIKVLRFEFSVLRIGSHKQKLLGRLSEVFVRFLSTNYCLFLGTSGSIYES